ncbi:unnamed protein product, partial [Mesorhabditis spiculigera]
MLAARSSACRAGSLGIRCGATAPTVDSISKQHQKLVENEPGPLWRVGKSPFQEIPQAWLSSLKTIKEEPQGIIDLHPDVFRTTPRLDLLHRNIVWQQVYRNVQLTKMLTKAEMPGGGSKPWPQKRTGRHHAGSIRAPHFHRGGFAHGVRGPKTWFYMLPDSIRIKGLCVALTVKHAQDDLQVVSSLEELPDGDPQFLMSLADERNWGYSVLFVSETDTITGPLSEATSQLPWMNVMPYYGLNCFSLMKYDTIVFSQKALNLIQTSLLRHLHRADSLNTKYRYKDIKEKILKEDWEMVMEVEQLIIGFVRDGFAEGSVTLIKHDAGRILVDTGSPDNWNQLEAELKLREIELDAIDTLVITHGHIDHCANLGRFAKATIYMDNDRRSPTGVYSPTEDIIQLTPLIFIKKYRGHTDNDLVVVVNGTAVGTIVVAGDLFETESDANDWEANSRYVESQKKARAELLSMTDWIVPGHGPIFRTGRK